jgi:hypothetical protein
MNIPMLVLTTASFLTTAALARPCEPLCPPAQSPSTTADNEPRCVDLAICLDTSGSMTGLIDAARTQLWAIVNDLAMAEPTPKLRVALLTYGNDGHNPENGWVRIDAPFTTDLDEISRQLFALTTNGGTELVGRVTSRAMQLDWHPSDDAMKLIIVAGNESADQDKQMPYHQACRNAISQGIMVNAIYCGNPRDSIAPAWRHVAKLADGHFAAIDQHNGTILISTPFDDRLAQISDALSATYVAYGENGTQAWANQIDQDANAQRMSPAAAAQRCGTKGSAIYQNTHWDLVDACRQKTVKLEDVKEEHLPEIMQPMTLQQRQNYVDQMANQRAQLQAEATELSAKRTAYVGEHMKQNAIDASRSFGHVVRTAVRQQAQAKGLRFQPEPTVDAREQPDSSDGA